MYWLQGVIIPVSFILNYIISTYAKEKALKHFIHPYSSLYDIIQVHTEPMYYHIPDIILLVLLSWMIICNAFLYVEDIAENLWCFSLSFILRSLFTQLTIFPSCVPSLEPTKYLKPELFCGTHDLMFSGHTTFFMFYGSLIECVIPRVIIKYVLPFLLVTSRQHYTIDVIVSMLVYNLIYYVQFYLNYA